jgi:predicted dehydrogenase
MKSAGKRTGAPLAVGIAGLGFMGGTHLAVYRQLKHKARVVALCDLEDKRLSERDPKGEARHTKSLAKLIADPEVELLDICLPTYLHREVSIAALKAGKHVICEKPLSLDYAQASQVAAAAAKAEGHFMTAQVLRFWPEYQVLTQTVRSGKLGRLRHLILDRFGAKPAWNWQNWIVDPKKSGGCLLDMHIHDIDYALYLFGRPRTIEAQGLKGSEGGYDHVSSHWEYGNGLKVTLNGGWGYPAGFPFRMGFTAAFEKGTVDWDTARLPKLTAYPSKGKPYHPEVPKVGAGESKGTGGNISNLGGYFVEIDYFLDCIRQGKKPSVVTPESSAEAVKAAGLEVRAIVAGKPVRYS